MESLLLLLGSEMASYILALRPSAQVFTVTPSSSVGSAVGDFAVIVAHPGLRRPLSAGENAIDLLSLSADALRSVARDWNERRNTSLLLLAAGCGVVVYLIYRKIRDGDEEEDEVQQRGDLPNATPPSGRTRGRPPSRWRARDWLAWIFGETRSYYLGPNESMAVFRGRYFGPSPSSERLQYAIMDSSRKKSVHYDALAAASSDTQAQCSCRKRRVHVHSSRNAQPSHFTSTPEFVEDSLNSTRRRSGTFGSCCSSDQCHSRLEADHHSHCQTAAGASCDCAKTGRFLPKQHRVKPVKLFHRVPPVGRDRLSMSPVVCAAVACGEEGLHAECTCFRSLCMPDREESIDSIASVTGSMLDMVKGAREVRRLIREASFDSLASSEFSLDFRHGDSHCDGASLNLDQLHREMSDLRDCLAERLCGPAPSPCQMASSVSDYALGTSPSTHSAHSGLSRVDGQQGLLRAHDHRLWKLTTVDSPTLVPSDNEPNMEWESPAHGWHDLKKQKYKFALGGYVTDEEQSQTDGLDAWEWDSEGLSPAAEDLLAHANGTPRHSKWLPETTENLELDLEAELCSSSRVMSSSSTSPCSSRRPSMDRSGSWYCNRVRQPPSGRSSVEPSSGDTPRQSIDHAALVKSFGVAVAQTDRVRAGARSGSRLSTASSSEESGFADETGSCCMGASVITLSPVHEVKEPGGSANSTPVKKVQARVLFGAEYEPVPETLQVKIETFK